MKKIKIQYLNDDIKRLEYIDGKSDWIDLRAAEDIVLKKDELPPDSARCGYAAAGRI